MLKGLIILLLFQLLGEVLVALLHSPVPGPVVGMLLLWLGLYIKRGASSDLQRASQTLIQYLSLFFLPAGVGLFFLPPSIQEYWPAVACAVVGGTFLSMLICAWLIKWLAARSRKGEAV